MRHAILAATLLVAACTTASSESAAPAAPAAAAQAGPAVPYNATVNRNPAEASSGPYTLDPRHVFVNFRFRHNGLGLSTYRFDNVTGTLNYNAAEPASSSVNVTIAANSLSTGLRNQAGELAWDREIQTMIGAEANPTITFVSTSARVTGPTTGIVTGNLTLNGQTHPVDLEVSYIGYRFNEARQRHALGFEGRAVIDRAQWGIQGGIIDAVSSREFEIMIQAEFNKAGA